MIVYKCDRCGDVFITPPTHLAEISPDRGISLLMPAYYVDVSETGRTDLCGGCAYELEQLLKTWWSAEKVWEKFVQIFTEAE